jgi:hypothetical protein
MTDPFSERQEFDREMNRLTLEQSRRESQEAALRYVHVMRPDWCCLSGQCAGCGKGKGLRR